MDTMSPGLAAAHGLPTAPGADGRRKPPRRTAERILATALDLFNRRGEPHVSTSSIAAELHISPGNLYYHFPAKDALVNALMARYEAALAECLAGRAGWALLPALFDLAWDYRFLFRDLNWLLAGNRQLEMRCQAALRAQHQALLLRAHSLHAPAFPEAAPTPALVDGETAEALATNLLLVLTYWLSHEYTQDPRAALEPGQAAEVRRRGLRQIHALLAPHLRPGSLAAAELKSMLT